MMDNGTEPKGRAARYTKSKLEHKDQGLDMANLSCHVYEPAPREITSAGQGEHKRNTESMEVLNLNLSLIPPSYTLGGFDLNLEPQEEDHVFIKELNQKDSFQISCLELKRALETRPEWKPKTELHRQQQN